MVGNNAKNNAEGNAIEVEGRHPFLEGLSKHRGAPPTVIVIFGASGDLTKRKLLPALYNLQVDSLLPADFHLIGYGRKPIENSEFQQSSAEAVDSYSRRALKPELWEKIAANTSFLAGGYDEAEAYEKLKAKIEGIEKDLGRAVQSVFYISTPPTVFGDILKGLGKSGLAKRHSGAPEESKVIIEKPFGRDLGSARQLNTTITQNFAENQVYRIDHYLGKETVQSLLVHRFANAIFEPLWNRNYVNHVQITVAESLGVGSRAGYYDQSGALRDMIQNHAMQLLALTAMEPPTSLNAESIRDEKVRVIKAIQPFKLTAGGGEVIRARYTEGLVDGEKVPAYTAEKGIDGASSTTETYAGMRLAINNWRWEGVPFYLRSGKRLAQRVSEIAVQFRRPPGTLFSAEGDRFDIASNTMVIRIQPDEGVTLLTNSKVPGLETRMQPVKMHFRYATTFGSNTPEAYERLILDCMVGDSTLFIRGDEAEASWKLFTPVLEHWEAEGATGLENYPAGSWGPEAADTLLAQKQHTWRQG